MLNRLAVLAVASLVALASCKSEPAAERLSVKPDVSFRVQVEGECSFCRTVPYSPGGRDGGTISIGKPIALPGDIEYLLHIAGEQPAIRFVFAPDAHERIKRVTTDNVGSPAVILVNDVAVSSFEISAPFSDGAEMTNLYPSEAHQLMLDIAGGLAESDQ